jgi:hypothetical protein
VSSEKINAYSHDTTIEILHRDDDPTSWIVSSYQKKFGFKFRRKEYRFIDGEQAAQFAGELKEGPLTVE